MSFPKLSAESHKASDLQDWMPFAEESQEVKAFFESFNSAILAECGISFQTAGNLLGAATSGALKDISFEAAKVLYGVCCPVDSAGLGQNAFNAKLAEALDVFSVEAGQGSFLCWLFQNYGRELFSGGSPALIGFPADLSSWPAPLLFNFWGPYVSRRPQLCKAYAAEVSSTLEALKDSGVEMAEADVMESSFLTTIVNHLETIAQHEGVQANSAELEIYKGNFSVPIKVRSGIGQILWKGLVDFWKTWVNSRRPFMAFLAALNYLDENGCIIKGAGRSDTRSIDGRLYASVIRDNAQQFPRAQRKETGKAPSYEPLEFGDFSSLTKADAAGSDPSVKESGPGASVSESKESQEAPEKIFQLPTWLDSLRKDFVNIQNEIYNQGPSEEREFAEASLGIKVYIHRDRPGLLEAITYDLRKSKALSLPKHGSLYNWLNQNLSAWKTLVGADAAPATGSSGIPGLKGSQVQSAMAAGITAGISALKAPGENQGNNGSPASPETASQIVHLEFDKE